MDKKLISYIGIDGCKSGWEYTRLEVKRNILINPFKRFEDMRFMKKSRDVSYVEFNKFVFSKLSKDHIHWVLSHCDQKLEEYYRREW